MNGLASVQLLLAQVSATAQDEAVRQENLAIAAGLKHQEAGLLDELIVRYQHRLLRYLLFLTSSRELAEDLFQEVWMRVLVRGGQFNGKSRFDTWLFTIARNLVIDYRRKRTVASLDELFDGSSEDDRPMSFEISDTQPTPFDRFASLEDRQRVAEALLAGGHALSRSAGPAVPRRVVATGDRHGDPGAALDGEIEIVSRPRRHQAQTGNPGRASHRGGVMDAGTPRGLDGGADPDRRLRASLAEGADREREVAYSTRRVVMASLGVIKEQKAGRKRVRAIAIASILVFLLVFGPLIWWAVDNLIAGERLGDLASQFSLWACIVCPALLAAAVMAGWLRHRS